MQSRQLRMTKLCCAERFCQVARYSCVINRYQRTTMEHWAKRADHYHARASDLRRASVHKPDALKQEYAKLASEWTRLATQAEQVCLNLGLFKRAS